MRSGIAVVLASALLLGCAPAQFYEGAPRPAAEVATFSSSLGDPDTEIVSIDGQSLYGDAATVLPGPHHVVLHLIYSDREQYELDLFCSVNVVAQAGHTYVTGRALKSYGTQPIPTRERYGRRIRIQGGIVDLASKKVAGVCDCRSEDPYACD